MTVITALAALGQSIRVFSPRLVFAFMSLLLVGYVATECYRLARETPSYRVLASPIFVASIFSLVIGFGITNYIFFLDSYTSTSSGSRGTTMDWLAQAQLAAVIGTVVMWIAFRSSLGTLVGDAMWSSRLLRAFVRRTLALNWAAFFGLLGLATLARVWQVNAGVYGVLGDMTEASTMGSYLQILNIIADFGQLALIGLALHVFSLPRSSLGLRLLLVFVVVSETFWGFLAADKMFIILPLLLVIIIFLIVRKRIPKILVATGLVMFVLAFAIIGPLRKIAFSLPVLNTQGTVELAEVVFHGAMQASAPTVQGVDVVPSRNLTSAIMVRLNQSGAVAFAMRHKAIDEPMMFRPAFLRDFWLAPLYAVVPRAIWPAKPNSTNYGVWFYRDVMGGHSLHTSAGFGFIGYLNYAGGLFMIMLGFAFFGVISRGLHERFALGGSGALFIAIAVVIPLGRLPTFAGGIFSTPLRIVFIALVIQFMLFRPVRYRTRLIPIE